MKKKYINETYLRGVDDYNINIVKDEEYNSYISVKYIKSIDKPYITTHTERDICLLDKGYYIIEYLPLNENYGVRVFMNDKKEVLQYYIDITKENSIENNNPFYYDLYLDITVDIIFNKVTVWDEDELKDALDSKDINKEDFDMAYSVLNRLLEEIKNNSNKFINIDHKNIIDKLM